ncbi:hypothetical protein P4S73_05345 [Paraglaciecola sp. Hal342]
MTQTYERMYSQNRLSQSNTKQSEIEQSEVDKIDFENAVKGSTEGEALSDNLDTNAESENAGQSAEQKENAQSFFDALSEIEGPRAQELVTTEYSGVASRHRCRFRAWLWLGCVLL